MSGKPKYPKEVYDFIKENYGEYGLTMLPIINDKFGINMSKDALLAQAYNRFHLKSYHVMDTDYTEEEESWISNNIHKFNSMKNFTNEFNRTFPRIKRTYNALQVKINKIGFSIQKISDEEIEWLKKNAPFHTSKELADMHNETFKKKRTYKSIRSMASKNGIKILSDKDAYFDYIQSNNSKVAEVGHIRLEKGDEYIKVAKSSSDNKIARKDMWIKRTRYEYEKAYGVKPKKWECVIQLDGDKTNYSKENLYLVPNYINGYILQYLGKLIKGQPELNKAHILRFEVEKAIKDYAEKHKDFNSKIRDIEEYIDQ